MIKTMCKSAANQGCYPQNGAIPLICTLDIQWSCNLSTFDNVIQHSESMYKKWWDHTLGLEMVHWGQQPISRYDNLLRLSFLFIFLVWYQKRRKRNGKWPKQIQVSLPQMPWWQQPIHSQLPKASTSPFQATNLWSCSPSSSRIWPYPCGSTLSSLISIPAKWPKGNSNKHYHSPLN